MANRWRSDSKTRRKVRRQLPCSVIAWHCKIKQLRNMGAEAEIKESFGISGLDQTIDSEALRRELKEKEI